MSPTKKVPRQNPNETRGSETVEENASGTCPECGMSQDEWKGNKGRGIQKDGQAYCCTGCAEQAGCTCSD